MSEETTNRTQQFNQVLQRFSKLNVGGMHYFIGRLIGGATDKPALTQEIERVLQRLETDSNLKRCWKAADSFGKQESPAPENAI